MGTDRGPEFDCEEPEPKAGCQAMDRNLKRLALLLLFATVAAASWHDIWNADLGFHLAGGRLIQETGSVPRVDPFSYTALGLPWNDFEWLYQWWTWVTWDQFGPAGVIVQHALLNLLTFFVLARVLFKRGANVVLVIAVLLLALVVCELRFSVRPHAVGRLFLAVFLAGLLLYRGDRSRRLWPLLPLQVLWCNMHGTYVLAIILTGFLVVDEWLEKQTLRKPLMLLGGLMVVSGLTPYGWGQLFSLVAHRQLVQGRSANPEWMPIPLTWDVLADPAAWAFALLAFGVGVLLWCRRVPNVGWFERGLWVVALFAPFMHVRLLPLSAIILALVTAVAAKDAPGVWARTHERLTLGVASVLLLLLLLAFVSNGYWTTWKRYSSRGLGVSRFAPGWGAGRFLAELDTGDVFNSYLTGGWLMYWLYPDGRVFIDGRDVGNVYTPDHFAEYQRILTDVGYFSDARATYQWNAVVLERKHDMCAALAAYLDQSKAWKVGYADEETVVFLPALLYEKGGP